MNRPFKYPDTAHAHAPATGAIPLVVASPRQSFNASRGARTGSNNPIKFPKRPDLSVLSEAIPLFYIGRNKHGFWVAREAERRSGGLFLRRRSALRFARKQSEPAGCATMFPTEPFELDIDNQGSRFVVPLATVMAVAARRAPAVGAFVGMAVSEWRKLVAEISRAIAGERRNRAAIERELFHGQYTLSSKNDDDLPIP